VTKRDIAIREAAERNRARRRAERGILRLARRPAAVAARNELQLYHLGANGASNQSDRFQHSNDSTAKFELGQILVKSANSRALRPLQLPLFERALAARRAAIPTRPTTSASRSRCFALTPSAFRHTFRHVTKLLPVRGPVNPCRTGGAGAKKRKDLSGETAAATFTYF
jgi:hypothetical protein